jgi:uncharacterized protein YcaQ
LLSPFDNLIRDRGRLERLFAFDYRIEIYTPKAKRRFGYYVMPILDGNRVMGRMDPAMDRASGRLTIKAVYAEPGAPAMAGKRIAASVEDLAAFLGASNIGYSKRIPAAWKRALVS